MSDIKVNDKVQFINLEEQEVSGTVVWVNFEGKLVGIKEDGITYPRTKAHRDCDCIRMSRIVTH